MHNKLLAIVRPTLPWEHRISLLDFINFCQTDIKSYHLCRHPREVATLARDIASHMGLSQYEQEIVYVAALFHDIGKFSAPDDLILGKFKLTPIEYLVIKSHALASAQILSKIPLFTDIISFLEKTTCLAEIVRYHHERYDASCYEGKSGEEVPLASAIIMLADSFSAATENKKARSYNDCSSQDLALILERFEKEHTQFHPKVYAAFKKTIRTYAGNNTFTIESLKIHLSQTDYTCSALPLIHSPKEICLLIDQLVQRSRQFSIPHNGTIYTIREEVEMDIISQSGDRSEIFISRADGSLVARISQIKHQLDCQDLQAQGFSAQDFLEARRLLRYSGTKAEFTCLGYSLPAFTALLAEVNISEQLNKILQAAWAERLSSFVLHTNNHVPEEEIIIACAGYLAKNNIRGTALDKIYAITQQFLMETGYDQATTDYLLNCLRTAFFIEYISILDTNQVEVLEKDVSQNKETFKKSIASFVETFPYFKKYQKTIINYYDKNHSASIDTLFSMLYDFYSSNGMLPFVLEEYSAHHCIQQFKTWLEKHSEYVWTGFLENSTHQTDHTLIFLSGRAPAPAM